MRINNIRIIDETQDFSGSVLLREGKILRVMEEAETREGEFADEPVLDGKGMALLPSFIDLHAHMREPGYEYKENLESGLSAALAGGFTQVCAMANTDPVTDSKEKVRANLEKAKKLDLARLIQVCAVTRDFADDRSALVDFAAIRPWTPIFSNDGKNMEDPQAMEAALRASGRYDFILSCHCEPETEMVERYIKVGRKVGGNLHICHISTRETMEAIRRAKEDGINITCEVTPHHLFSWDDTYRVAPPLPQEKM
ncbi:amidohydrolase family protein [Alkalibacter rhizosphaerae]|uniref:amidohydrolase family protein n=1 Tax=Alkalibacter rhizosphaerae TaxID=2815577 RepID=UPI001FEFE6FF|nr:amidohydrolase family protein [Alkalibacter rhizosphaerae]